METRLSDDGTDRANSAPGEDVATARAALAAARDEEERTRSRPNPAWYGPVAASLILLAHSAQTFEAGGGWRIVQLVSVLLAATALSATAGYVVSIAKERGAKWQWTPSMVAQMVLCLAVCLLPMFVFDAWGRWIWPACGLALAVYVMIASLVQHRRWSRG